MELKVKNTQKIWPYVGVFIFFWLASNMMLPYLGLLYENKGYTDSSIGILSGLFQFVVVLSAVLIGLFEDRVGKPGRIIAILTMGMTLSSIFLCKSSKYWITFVLVILFGFCYAPINGITDKALMESLKIVPEKYAKCRSGGTIGAGTGIIIAAFLIKKDDFSAILFGFCIALIPCFICALFFTGEKKLSNNIPALSDYIYLIRNKNSFSIYFALAAWGFSESGTGVFQAIFIENIGYPVILTSLFIGVAMVGEFIGFQMIAKINYMFCYEKWIAFSFLLQFLRIFAIANTGKMPLSFIILLQFTGGASFAIIHSIITFIIDESYPDKILYMAHSLKRVASNGLGNMFGLIFLGQAFERGGDRKAYIIIALVSAVMTILFLGKNRKFYKIENRG